MTLAVGPEAFLAERAVSRVLTQVKAADPDTEVTTTDGSLLTAAQVGELLGPSLFAATRVLVVNGVDQVDPDEAKAVASTLADVPEDAHVVLLHPGGNKGQRVLKAVRPVADEEVSCVRIAKAEDRLDFVRTEVRAARGKIDPQAAQQLVDAVGGDLRSLAAACSQLVADSNDGMVTVDLVSDFFEGRAEVKGWTIADLAVSGQTGRALLELRWALGTGTAPVLVVGALASSLRTLARLQAVPPGARDAEVARDLGVPPWKVRALRGQLRGWRPDSLGNAIQRVAETDRAVKGEAIDQALALSRAIIDIAALKRSASPL